MTFPRMKVRFSLFVGMHEANGLSGEILGPVTSTPAVRRAIKANGQQAKDKKGTKKHQIKVSVHDGQGMHRATISSSDPIFDLLEKIAAAMKRSTQQVEMGYEAPWSHKIKSKKCISYITNSEELDEFWMSFFQYSSTKKIEDVQGIVFHNMKGSTEVSCLLLTFCIR